MTQAIRAVLFDLGGTLENTYYDDESRLDAARGLRELMAERGLNTGLSVTELLQRLTDGLKAYQRWREKTEIELPPERVFVEYVFPDLGLDKERLAAAAEDLAFFYETHYHRRQVRPEAPATIAALYDRGFRLGVISNIMSRRLVPHCLAAYGLARYFDPVLTSVEVGWRKPNPRIFLEATRRLGLAPAECAYVGDTVSRDVIGARRSGYGLAIQIKSFLTTVSDRETDVEPPDALIQNLSEVLDLVTHG